MPSFKLPARAHQQRLLPSRPHPHYHDDYYYHHDYHNNNHYHDYYYHRPCYYGRAGPAFVRQWSRVLQSVRRVSAQQLR